MKLAEDEALVIAVGEAIFKTPDVQPLRYETLARAALRAVDEYIETIAPRCPITTLAVVNCGCQWHRAEPAPPPPSEVPPAQSGDGKADCAGCEGLGVVPETRERCDTCRGTGHARKP